MYEGKEIKEKEASDLFMILQHYMEGRPMKNPVPSMLDKGVDCPSRLQASVSCSLTPAGQSPKPFANAIYVKKQANGEIRTLCGNRLPDAKTRFRLLPLEQQKPPI
jgi:hypothetical protein